MDGEFRRRLMIGMSFLTTNGREWSRIFISLKKVDVFKVLGNVSRYRVVV